MNARSAKNKGNRFENYLIDLFRKECDSKAHRTYGSGNGLDKQDVRLPAFNVEVEAKNQKTIKLLDWWEQCQRQQTTGNVGVLAIRNPRKPEFQEILIVMSSDYFTELLKGYKGEAVVESNFSPNLKWKIQRARQSLQEVFKELEN
jgi:hypothetical protein